MWQAHQYEDPSDKEEEARVIEIMRYVSLPQFFFIPIITTGVKLLLQLSRLRPKNPTRLLGTKVNEREPSTSSETFHFRFMAVFFQPSPLSRVFGRNLLLLLQLAGGSIVVIETVNESEGVPGD